MTTNQAPSTNDTTGLDERLAAAIGDFKPIQNGANDKWTVERDNRFYSVQFYPDGSFYIMVFNSDGDVAKHDLRQKPLKSRRFEVRGGRLDYCATFVAVLGGQTGWDAWNFVPSGRFISEPVSSEAIEEFIAAAAAARPPAGE